MKKNKLFMAMMALLTVMAFTVLGGGTTAEAAAKGKYFTSGDLYYHTISDKKVEVCGTTKTEGTLTIPSSVTYKGKKYTVTKIADHEIYDQSGFSGLEGCDADIYNGGDVYYRYDREDGKGIPITMNWIAGNRFKKVVLPNTLTKIGDGAFCGNTELETVIFATSYKKLTIGENVFGGTKLKSIVFPKGTYELKDSAAGNVPNITIPASVKKIGPGVVNVKTKSVTIDKKNKYFKMKNGMLYSKDEKVLYGASAKVSSKVKISSKTKKIADKAFWASTVKEVTLNKNIKTIPKGAFSDCKKLISVKNMDNVTAIKYGAFGNCWKLKDIGTLSKVKTIERAAFWQDSKLKPFTISSKMDIDEYAFSGTANETRIKVKVAENDPVYSIVNGLLIKKDGDEQIVIMQTEDAENLIVPEGVTQIAVTVGNSKAKTLTLPSTLKVQSSILRLNKGTLIFTGATVPEFGADFDGRGVEMVYVPKGTKEAYRKAMDEAVAKRDGCTFFDDEFGPFIKEQ